MKFALLLVALLFASAPVRSAAPADVAGLVVAWSESTATNLFHLTASEYLLGPDGTCTSLLVRDYEEGYANKNAIAVLSRASLPPVGRWSYRRIDANAAELTVNGRVLRLSFDDSDRAGLVTGLRSLLTPRFAFRDYVDPKPVANHSTRAFIAPGRSVTIGFVLARGDRRVLVRVVGPGLRRFGVTDALASPRFSVHRAADPFPPLTSQQSDAYFAAALIEEASLRAGAFPLAAGDRGVLLPLQAGAHTVEVSATDPRMSGEVLVEVYQLP